MIVETPTVKKYKQSFVLFLFRMLDLIRMAPTVKLQEVLKKEVIFLYDIYCLLIDKQNYESEVNYLILWASTLGVDIKLDVFKDMYSTQLNNMDLQDLVPQSFLFSFTTIWDSIHLMSMVTDNIIYNRTNYTIDKVMDCVKNIKWFFYNIFIILFCPLCARHYLTVNNFPYEVERIEVALYREKQGEPLQFVEELNCNQNNKNVLLKHHLLYKSMEFHNHVNNYRPIQHGNNELNNFQRMSWSIYKTLLGIL